jgi:hypothetical protein
MNGSQPPGNCRGTDDSTRECGELLPPAQLAETIEVRVVNVVVTDRDGKPVTRLTKDDASPTRA